MGAERRALAPAEAAEGIRGGWQVLDVRLAHERADDGFIAGSIHIELTELTARAGELDAERTVLVYCRGGTRSAMAAEALSAGGFDAKDLDGGIVGWIEAGMPITAD